MADAPTAVDVGHIITYIAPGYFANKFYEHRYSRPEKEQFNLFVVSVAASLPLVAATNQICSWLDISTNPTHAAYALLLLGLSVVAGVALRIARDSDIAIKRFKFPPRGTVLSTRLLRNLPAESSVVTLTLKSGRILSGTPQSGTGDPDSPARELYVNYPAWWNDDKEGGPGWTDAPDAGGVIINLEDVESIALGDDPKET